jgi:hypothetical protein
MILCPNCAAPNRDTAHYCRMCRVSLRDNPESLRQEWVATLKQEHRRQTPASHEWARWDAALDGIAATAVGSDGRDLPPQIGSIPIDWVPFEVWWSGFKLAEEIEADEVALKEKKRLQEICDRPTVALPLIRTAEEVEDESTAEDTTMQSARAAENEPNIAAEALKPGGQDDPTTAYEVPVPAEPPAREQKPRGRPKGSALYSDSALFFYRIGLGWDRARERGHLRPTPEHVYEALRDMEAKEVPGVITLSADTIRRGVKEHMGKKAVWNDYRELRAKGLREPQ